MRELRILSPTAILGYGFPEASFEAGLARDPHVIAVDAGSTDPGPWYLGAGVSFTDREAVKRDLGLILRAGHARGIPVVVGSAGGAGARPHLDWTLAIVDELVAEHGLRFRLARIDADQPPAPLRAALAQGRLRALPPGPPATEYDVSSSTHVVAQMGTEPFVEALRAGATLVVAGRAYDPAVFAALPLLQGYPAGLALHLGKILECAAIAAHPGSGADCMLGTLRDDHFDLEALSPARRCTLQSVAAHTLYEKSDPVHLPGPGGALDLSDTTFTELPGGIVRVAGSRFVPAPPTVKLEGARPAGFRTVSVAGARDPAFIVAIDHILADVRTRVDELLRARTGTAADWQLQVLRYGRDGVMGDLEPLPPAAPHELGLVIETTAPTQALADTACALVRSTLLHWGFPGRVSTAGNLAFPFSPSDFQGGAVYRFSLYHLLDVDDLLSPFPIRYRELGA